ncbi:hypothetical protein [Celerinatantimonas sp. MCCC 1A17872]|uniref:hypothetical protein n=1 Tax=Celerinatantimonas sp. MCCC 1A17872 TaxID=3177514 RepID=UPI0038C641FF
MYGSKSYTSQKVTLQKPTKPKGIFKKLLSTGQTTLPYIQPDEQIPEPLLKEFSPQQWREGFESTDKELRYNWNEQFIQIYIPQLWGRLYLLLAAFAKVIVLYFSFAAIFSFLVVFIKSDYDWVITARAVYIYLEWLFLPSALIWLQFELSTRFCTNPWFLKPRLYFELNRQNGLVTLYGRFRRVRFQHPFIEFDCVLTSAPYSQGLIRYGLMLVHRYQGYRMGVPLSVMLPGGSQARGEYVRLWNFVLSYMDVSRPLPDTLALEMSRPEDPTTAAEDSQTGRPARYWRDMDEATFKVEVAQRVQRHRERIGEGPLNIFESIE